MRFEALAMLAMLLACSPVQSSPAKVGDGGLARELLKGCLSGPSKDGMAMLAASVGAAPFSAVRTRHAVGHPETFTVVDDNTRPEEAQRTETTVTAFSGWDLPGPSAGSLEYSEGEYRTTRVEVATGQPIQAWREAHTKDCQITAPVASARKIFEIYEKMNQSDYGILIGADRRWISVFTFDPDHYDIELHLRLDAPFPGLKADVGSGNTRLVLTDGGPRFSNDPGPGVPTVTTTRAALLSWLDHRAVMNFGNEALEPVVQRLSQLRASARDG